MSKTMQETARELAEDILRPLGLTQTAFLDREKEILRVTGVIQQAMAAGLYKAVEITEYWRQFPMRNDAYRGACVEIEISCRATAGRVLRGEYENPTTSVGD